MANPYICPYCGAQTDKVTEDKRTVTYECDTPDCAWELTEDKPRIVKRTGTLQ